MLTLILWIAGLLALTAFAIAAAGIATVGTVKPPNDDPED
jgi:hypothetical protein